MQLSSVHAVGVLSTLILGGIWHMAARARRLPIYSIHWQLYLPLYV
jgi:hypothetical protein